MHYYYGERGASGDHKSRCNNNVVSIRHQSLVSALPVHDDDDGGRRFNLIAVPVQADP